MTWGREEGEGRSVSWGAGAIALSEALGPTASEIATSAVVGFVLLLGIGSIVSVDDPGWVNVRNTRSTSTSIAGVNDSEMTPGGSSV